MTDLRPYRIQASRRHGGGLFREKEGSTDPMAARENFFKKTQKTFAKPLDILTQIVYNITVAFKRHARVAELADAHV